MTNHELLLLAALLVKYLSGNPLSHHKRNILHEVLAEVIELVDRAYFPTINENGDIPF